MDRIVVKQAASPAFVPADLVFEPTMYVTSFHGHPFGSTGGTSRVGPRDPACLWMATCDHSALLMMSAELWRVVEQESHAGAYGEYGAGHVTLDVDGRPMTLLKKVAIDVEGLHGFRWDADRQRFEYDEGPFVVPYGTRVHVGEYTLAPYRDADPYGFDHGERFTKWRTQAAEHLYGVHCLQRDSTVFAMIPSVVVQLSCPEGATRHLCSEREPDEERWATHMVETLRARGLHARDVHAEHHGVVIMNKTPAEFVSAMEKMVDVIDEFGMARWIASYAATFGASRAER